MLNASRPEPDQEALRQSEERYRLLVNSIDEGFCLIEMIYDEQGQPIDWLYLEANPTFERQTGIDPVGQRVSQVVGPVDAWWFTFYHQVLLSQTPAHTENQLSSLNRWYSIRAAPVENYPHRLAVIFDDITQRRADQEAVRTSEEKYRTLFDTMAEGLTIFGVLRDEAGHLTDLRYQDINRALEEQTGLDRKAIIGRLLSEVLPQTDLERWLPLCAQAVADGQPATFEEYVALTDRWYLVSFYPGGQDELISFYRDITDHKREEQRQHFRLTLSDALRPINHPTDIEETATRLAMTFFEADRCYYCQLIDGQAIITRDARRGQLPSVAGTSPLSSFPLYKKVIDGKRPFIVEDARTSPILNEELRAICLSLQVMAFLNIPVIKQGMAVGILCLMQSTPRRWTQQEIQLQIETAERIWAAVERARAEDALRQREEQFRLLITASSDSLYRMSADWSQMLNLKGMSFLTDTQQANAQWLERYIPDADQPNVEQAIHQAIQAKQPFELEHRVIRADGSVGWTLSRAIPLVDEEGKIREWFGAASDITDRKGAEQALRQADRRKDEFLAMLAHELRNPMATLHNTLLLMKLTQGQDETLPLERALTLMNREVTHLNRMVDDLLDVSRISQGKIQLKKERLELNGLIREAIEGIHFQLSSLGHALTVQLPHEPIWVDGDPTRLTQVVGNLLLNAAKYTPPGGQIRVQLGQEMNQAVLRIRDTGIGLAADQLGIIFEVFAQVSPSLDRPQGGLGLGLAVVKQLVELHGGQVGVQSAGLGQGSEFTVHLPTLAGADASTPSAGIGEERTKKAGRIVVVDDNADLALTTALLLRVKKYEANTCLSGEEALSVVAALQPDAVLLDLGMPGLDGYETCRRLRALDWGRQGVIVALSGYGEEADKKRTQMAGFDGHLVKPVNLPTLTALLDQLLGGSNQVPDRESK